EDLGYLCLYDSERGLRESQRQILLQEKTQWGDEWFAMGDWNDICSPAEKKGGRKRNACSFLDFNSFISSMEMEEVTMAVYQFTWANNREEEGLCDAP
ncbi:Unknown protein, partial [Striga hermonthica]